ncbi:MAG: M23 family metallopeptidase [Myxococcales bacterium]|nr:M23 family metallopeptidase [Myxococcales bacterium]
MKRQRMERRSRCNPVLRSRCIPVLGTLGLVAALGLGPRAASAVSVDDLLGSWHVLAHYKDSATDHPDRERWVDRVWKFEREGGKLEWSDYPIVVFDDSSGRFERLGTNRQSRVLAFWEPSPGQIANIQKGLEVNQRGAKSKSLKPGDEGGWTSAGRARPGSMTMISYVETWTIDGLPGLPVFQRADSLSSGMTETLEGVTRYTTTSVSSDGLLLHGRFERDGTQQGTFRMMRSGGTQWVQGSGKSPNERFREMAVSQYRVSESGKTDLRAALEESLGEAGVMASSEELDRMSERIVALSLEGKSPAEITRVLEEEMVAEARARQFDFAPEGARHDDSVRYGLPFRSDTQRLLVQGNAGSFDHRDTQEYAFDFRMPTGETVVAARAGEVVAVIDDHSQGGRRKSMRSKANAVIVLHDDGSFGTYVHLSPGAAVVPGDRVKRGQKLGRSGATGYTADPMLHFGVMVRGADGKARTVPIRFDDGTPGGFVPTQGGYYGGTAGGG